MNHEFVNGWYQIRLDDGTIVSKASRHCMQPRLVNGFLIYTGCEPNGSMTVAHELATGIDYEQPGFSGKNVFQTDGRFILLVAGWFIGDWANHQRDLVGVIFDTQAKTWLNFPGNPLVISGGAHPQYLWIKKGSGVNVTPNDPPDNPPGFIVSFDFTGPGLLQWSTMSLNSANIPALDTMFPDRNVQLAKPFKQYNRTIDLTTGNMGAIALLNESETPPTWL